MKTCDKTPLLSTVESCHLHMYDNDGLISTYDSSSSGYESNDLSDAEPDRPTEPEVRLRTHDVPTVKCKEVGPKVIRYKSTYHLSEDLKLILDMPEMCDVTFLVGSSRIPVNGVRAILATRSRVFYNLLLKHIHARAAETGKQKNKKSSTKVAILDRLCIPVRKYDSEVFRGIVQFLHCGSVTITEETVSGLLCGADQFELPELEAACWKFIDRCLATGRGEALLLPTRCYRHSRKCDVILRRIYSVLDREFLRQQSQPSEHKESTV